MRATSAFIIALVLAPVLLTASRSQAAPHFTITDLGALGSPDRLLSGWGINESAQVVGYSSVGGLGVPALYTNGTVQSLGTLGGTRSPRLVNNAYDINNSGQIVGGAATSAGNLHAFLYSDGVMTDLGTLGGSNSWGSAINDAGQVAGRSWITGDSAARAFLYSDGVMHNLGTLNAATHSVASGINSHGQVVGQSGNVFLYSDGVMHDLGPGQAYDINDNGMVVGSTFDGIAAFYNDGTWHEIGTLGGRISEAIAVNNHGQIVGYSQVDTSSIKHAFLYSDGVMYDLNSLIDASPGWPLEFAFAINDRGQITGDGGFLLTPTPNPEPGSIALLGVGLVGLLIWGRRRLGWQALQFGAKTRSQ